MFWSKSKKNSIPQFYYIKVGYEGVFIARICFVARFVAKYRSTISPITTYVRVTSHEVVSCGCLEHVCVSVKIAFFEFS